MKKYIAPAINVLNIATDESLMLTMSNAVGGNELSNKNVSVDEDWEDEE